MKSVWGHDIGKLKYTYEKEYEEKPVEKIQMSKEEFDKYIKELFRQIRPNLKSIIGAMHEKRKALTHEYPSKYNEFEKWGFDPKQYHHIVRHYHLLCSKKSVSYMMYDGLGRSSMIDIKRNKDNLSKDFVEKDSDITIENAKKLIPDDYKYEPSDLSEEVSKYIEDKLKVELHNTDTTSAREYRTFDNDIPKKDLEKFPVLEQYKGKDVSYIVYESIEIL